ncbi:hypothetical protein AMTR_s00013p00134090 [Amborella trichopoda]|uniref:Uncharacterized protein n=1 Tax=Amborella trichopoda TaxID=13333 RepID=W1PIT1_AMBTC|nr:hypothetical protein AMTR_s00013p00134090 [Amborella trichopoda]
MGDRRKDAPEGGLKPVQEGATGARSLRPRSRRSSFLGGRLGGARSQFERGPQERGACRREVTGLAFMAEDLGERGASSRGGHKSEEPANEKSQV